jgi:type IV pilus assembly protein PilY1
VGSGDREKPLLDYGSAAAVNNYFFSVIDQPLVAGWTDDDADGTCGVDMVCMDALTSLDLDGVSDLVEGEELSPKGWKFALATNEQVVSGALTLASVTNFSTHIARPDDLDPETCQPQLGVATTYNLDYLSATGETNNIIGGGLVPTPVGGYVELDDGTVVPFCIGCGDEGSAIGGGETSAGSAWTQPKNRVYWNIKK